MPKFALGAILVCLAGSALAVFLLFHDHIDGDQRLQQRIVSELKRSRGVVEVRELTDFTWDRLCIFGPYTPDETVAEVIGFQWPTMKALGAKDREGFNLLVFVKARAVVAYVDEPRGVVGFFGFKSGECLTPDNGQFRFTKRLISAVRPLSSVSERDTPSLKDEEIISFPPDSPPLIYRLARKLAVVPNAVRLALAGLCNGCTIAEPGARWNSTDLISDPSIPTRRLVWAGSADSRWLIRYEHGGRGMHDHIVVFEVTDSGVMWRGGGSGTPQLPLMDFSVCQKASACEW